jgi:hypothetical protein
VLVQNREYLYNTTLEQKVNSIWESTEKAASRVSILQSVCFRSFRHPFYYSIEL